MVPAQDQEEHEKSKNGREKDSEEDSEEETGSSSSTNVGIGIANLPWRPGPLRKRDAPVVLWHVRIISEGPSKNVFEYERATFEHLKSAIDQGLQGEAEGPPSDQRLPRARHVVLSQVCGWGVYCYDFLLLPIAPSVSCSCVDALNTPSSKPPLSPTVSRFLQPV